MTSKMAQDPAIKYSMAGSVEDAGAKDEPPVSTTTDDTDDSISITSTPYDSDDSQVEYLVEDILSQDDDMDGVTKYLVQWTGYPLEKCTWEPAENMGPDLLRDLWDTKKKRKDYQPFDLSLFYSALAQKEGRHMRRNLKRKKRGLPQTHPFLEEDDLTVVGKPTTEDTTATDGETASPVQNTVLPTADSGSIKSPGTELIDITQDSDDDVVTLESLSTPAATKKKKKKGSKQSAIQTKGKGKAELSTTSKKRSSTALATSQTVDETSAVVATSTASSGHSRQSENMPSVASAIKPNSAASLAASLAAPKTSDITSRCLSKQNAPTPISRDQTNTAPKQHPVKAPNESSKNGSSTGNTGTHNAKTFSARKTSKGTLDTSNAFNSGKKIPARPILIDNMLDPTKPKQLFTSRRTLRLAELQERDKFDAIIDPSKLSAHLFPISKGPPGTVLSSANTSSRRPSLARDASSTGSSIPTLPVPKRKKSVRFSDLGDDDESVVTRIRLISPPAGGTALDDEESMVLHQQPGNVGVRLPDRAVKLLAGAQQVPLDVILSVTAHDNGTELMLDEILSGNLLKLSYSCLANTLLHQLEGIRNKVLFCGNIAADMQTQNGSERLDTISERLRTMAAGLVFFNTEYAFLLYPTRCEDWSEERFRFPTPGPNDAGSPLRFVVFSTYYDASSLLRPPKSATNDYEIPAGLNEREYLLQTFTGLDRTSFARLFPQLRKHSQRTAFLAFPPSSFALMQQLAFWIRGMDPACAVLCSSSPGAWLAFCDKISAGSEDGIVIVHELVTTALWRFPNLSRLLNAEKATCRFWSFSQSILSPSLFPSIEPIGSSESDVGGQVDAGRITLTRLFTSGLAIFITPSFILSEPQRTRDLLQWVLEEHETGNITVTLVMAWDIREYLLKSAEEKLRVHGELYRDEGFISKSSREWAISQAGATPALCRLRYEIYSLACEICDTQETATFHPVKYANKAIDGDDEQSLVNWFGWWALSHLDEYRGFHVLASDTDITKKKAGFSTRKVRVPIFTPDTVADPDVAWERMHNAPEPSLKADGQSELLRRSLPSTRHASTASAAQSQLFPDASPSDFTSYLMKYSRTESFWRIYGFAVYWRNADEAFQYGTLLPAQFSIASWFSFAWAFDFSKFRTYIAFFNMIDDACDKELVQQETRPLRHPFVVIYRPVNPHLRQFFKTELIIWDVRAKGKFQGRDVLYMDDLTSAQRAVVEHVKEHGFQKNKMPLSRVYIGGEPFKTHKPTPVLSERRSSSSFGDHVPPNSNELDATIEYVDALASDIKNAAPAADHYLEDRGFKEVTMDKKRPSEEVPRAEQHGSGCVNNAVGSSKMTPKEPAGKARIVFHAPRGDRMRHVESSKCRNYFYETARQARMQSPQQSMMELQFRPTVDWYREQVEEGRGYEYLHVDTWRPFFDKFGIRK